MTTRLRVAGAVTLIAALSCFAAASAAARAAAPKVIGASHVPLVAAAGDRIAVTVKIKGTGKRVALTLVLGTVTGSPKGGVSLGRGTTFKGRGVKRVVVRGRVPKTVALNELRTLLVCVSKGACSRAARIATSGTSSEERLAGARRAGRISKGQDVLYGLRAMRGDKRVPRELRGGIDGPSGEQAAIVAAAGSYRSLPRALQKQVLPFFLPPQMGASGWSTPGRNTRMRKGKGRAKRAVAAAAGPDCSGYGNLSSGIGPREENFPWQGVPTSDGKAIVWYGTSDIPKWKRLEGEERASAQAYARELPKIWTKLTAEFGQPLSDAGEGCFHGPDGRLDVYVGQAITTVGAGLGGHALGVTVPYPAVGNFPVPGQWCTNRPSWIALHPGMRPWVLAHEFMHVLQFSHRYQSCDPPIAWWDEGGATWAGDFVYPDDQYEHARFPDLVTDALGQDLLHTDYTAWPFWMMLQRTQGTGVLRSIFASLRSKRPYEAVDAAIPGGFARQLPRFFLHAFNQSPIGDAGFEIPESFKAWDKWSATPNVPGETSIALGGLPERIFPLLMQRGDFPALSVGGYQRLKIGDDKIKELQFTNDLAGKRGGHVDALLHLASGSWKLADWSAKTTTLCRDKPDQNVTELVIVSTNTGKAPLGKFAHKLRARTSCAPHVYKILSATLTETFTGTKAGITGCPPSTGLQTNTMTLTNVAFQPGANKLFEGFDGTLIGPLIANGTKQGETTMHGCDLGSNPVVGCVANGSGPLSGGVMINVTIPPKSPTADVQWTLTDPTAGLGSEGAGTTCFITPIAWTLDDQSIGKRTVPVEIFEAETPQSLSIAVDFDLTDPLGAQIHASENYALTIQRVREDGSPL